MKCFRISTLGKLTINIGNSKSHTQNTLKIVKNRLIGNYYTRFSYGDTFDLRLDDDYWLIAQNISTVDETLISSLLEENYRSYSVAVDQCDIAKNMALSALMRQRIVDVELDNKAVLKLSFENREELIFTTDTEIVDWHWVLKRDPYSEYIIGCFNPGEVEINDNF